MEGADQGVSGMTATASPSHKKVVVFAALLIMAAIATGTGWVAPVAIAADLSSALPLAAAVAFHWVCRKAR